MIIYEATIFTVVHEFSRKIFFGKRFPFWDMGMFNIQYKEHMQASSRTFQKCLSGAQNDITIEFLVKKNQYVHFENITRAYLRGCFLIFFNASKCKSLLSIRTPSRSKITSLFN